MSGSGLSGHFPGESSGGRTLGDKACNRGLGPHRRTPYGSLSGGLSGRHKRSLNSVTGWSSRNRRQRKLAVGDDRIGVQFLSDLGRMWPACRWGTGKKSGVDRQLSAFSAGVLCACYKRIKWHKPYHRQKQKIETIHYNHYSWIITAAMAGNCAGMSDCSDSVDCGGFAISTEVGC